MTKLSRGELAEKQRWEERYGDGPLRPIVFNVTKDSVQIGDEFFKVSDLKKAARKNPQPKDHAFKPHHYVWQESLNELKAFYAKHPDRKPKL
jgi:hypothetical protein